MTHLYQDIHQIFRYLVPGMLFLFLFLLFTRRTIFDGISGISTFILVSFIMGFIFFSIFQFIFSIIYRKNHFFYLIKEIMKTIKNGKLKRTLNNWNVTFKDWNAVAINDILLYLAKPNDNNCDEHGRGRITFMTSKFYMHGTIVVSQFALLFFLSSCTIFHYNLPYFFFGAISSFPVYQIRYFIIPFDSLSFFAYVTSIFFIVYSSLELYHNYNLVKEFNKVLLIKIWGEDKNIKNLIKTYLRTIKR